MTSELIPIERIETKILLLRGQKVILDRDLAALYGVPTKALKRAVKRNITRFPDDFAFVLDGEEFTNWRRQFGTSNSDRMGLRYAPMAFTEHGIAMLSSVLNSERAIQVNISIMRAFSQLRALLATHADLAALYDVPTKALKQAIKRNLARFPDDFMFVLDSEEFANWRSQFVTSNSDRMGLRYAPMAFTDGML